MVIDICGICLCKNFNLINNANRVFKIKVNKTSDECGIRNTPFVLLYKLIFGQNGCHK